MKYDLVVQRSAIERMRMANDSSVRGIGSSSIEQGFEAAGRAFQKQGADCAGLRLHRVQSSIAAKSQLPQCPLRPPWFKTAKTTEGAEDTE